MYSSMSEMHCTVVTYLTALATILSQSAGELVIAPRNTESKVGETTYFNCSTDLESVEIFWYHGVKTIYNGHGILEPYSGRFDIDRNASMGSHNLVIHSVEPNDAGEFICADDDGSGTRRSAELIVLDNDPDCQSNVQPEGVIGQNIFNIPPDDVQLTCNVTYHGNIPPQMEWKKVGDYGSIKDSLTSTVRSTNRLIYTLKFKGDISLDNSSYVCQTTRSTQNQYKCTSEIIKVLYFIGGNTREQKVVRGDQITCIAINSTFPCISQWYHDNYTCPLPCNETITTHLLGEYLCTVKCHVRGRDYYFEALKAFVVEPITSPSLSTSDTIAVAVPIVIIVLIISVVSIAVLTVRNKRMKKKYEQRVMEKEMEEYMLDKQGRCKTHESERENDKITEEEIELLHKIKKEGNLEEKDILGIAILNEDLFIVHENSSTLKVYNYNNFSDCKLQNVKELVDTYDMCSCRKNNCIYIMDRKTGSTPKEVLRISTDGNSVGKWLTKYNAAGNLSATTEGNVIITVQFKQMLLEYSYDGKFEREINLPNCANPMHAIKRDDRYIVCHGGRFEGFHRVCLVDKEGNVEKSFGYGIGSAKNQLCMPSHLAAGSNGCFLVADHCNNRVLLLDSNLQFKTKIVPKNKQRFRHPRVVSLGETLLAVQIEEGVPNEITSEEAGDSRKERKEGDISTQNNHFLIERDCRILVFDIQPLLQKYNL